MPLTGHGFKPPQPKGKGVYVSLMFLIVVAGFFLQLNWMQKAKEREMPAMDPNSFASKLGQWMLEKKGVSSSPGIAGAPGVETVECGNCLGTGGILSEAGQREICPICLGVGSRLIRRVDPADELCPACVGMGRVQFPDTGEYGTCPRCNGRGLIRSGAAGGEAAPGGQK